MLGWIAGFAAGAAHALLGPDHVAAVAPLAIDDAPGAWRLGLRWGAGHACAATAAGGLALALRGRLDLERVSSGGEALVGVVLVALGIWGLRRACSRFIHVHEHEHGGVRHRHLHLHPRGVAHPHSLQHRHRHLAFGLGLLHGASGASHLLAVLPVMALPDLAQAAAYIVSFGLGSMVAMAACSGLLGALAGCSGGSVRAYRWLLGAAGSVSVATGAVWVLG